MNEPTHRSRSLDSFAPFLALAGLAASLVPDYLRVRTWEVPATDFKTLFASVRLFTEHQNPYAATLIHQVFSTGGVIQPANWFGHAAVYPPFTLALLTPLAACNMATAAWIWFIVSAALMALALAAMLRWSRDELQLPLWMRMIVLAACVGCQLLGFGLEIGNVSTATAALCIFTFCSRKSVALRSIALAIAFLLKPHMAIWLCLAMLFSTKVARSIAIWSAAIAATFISLTSAILVLQHRAVPMWASFWNAVLAESIPGGSNSPLSREVLPLGAQFSSVWAIAGYWPRSSWLLSLMILVLVACAVAIAWSVRQSRNHLQAPSLTNAAIQGLLACDWMALGMIAIYHRQHDAQMLLLFLPVAAFFLFQTEAWPWTSATLVLLLGTWIDLPALGSLHLRQASIISLLFALFCHFLTIFVIQKSKKKPV